ILNAGSVNGTFGALVNSNLPANFSDTLSYDAGHAYLNLALSFAPPTGSSLGDALDANQRNVANALINYFSTTGGIPMVYGTLDRNGLSQASGQPGASTAQPALAAAGQFVNAVFDSAFDSYERNGPAGLHGEYQPNAYAAKREVSRDARDAYAAMTPRDRPAPSFVSRWSVWASAYGGNSRVNGDASAGGSTTTSRVFGTAVGAAYRFAPNTQVGFALGGSGSSFDLDGGFGGGKADIFNTAVYAKHTSGAAYVAGLLAYSWQDTTTDRTVTVGGTDTLHASFKAQAFVTRLESGWHSSTPAIGVTPYAALQTTTFYQPSYGETATSGSGNAFALNYASKAVTATRGELGAKFDKAVPVQNGLFTLKAKAAWAHDWNTDRTAIATFQTLPGATFTVNGAQPAANAVLASLGGEMVWHGGWSLGASFDGEFSRNTMSYAGRGVVKYAW
ncbi:MAG TPA: autotransporter outer membrane beta-barrel domain-containing protein, partial [Candidatus Saccharimonadales bacterium]|nr:autotransporter outer membrane beta-barrel domain-containing protein [Candidatus Saccharimonadales bacterium]